MYETLKKYEEEVEEILDEQKKKEKPSGNPIALVADKRSHKEVFGSRDREMVNYDSEKQGENTSDADEDDMREAMRQVIFFDKYIPKEVFQVAKIKQSEILF